MPLIEANGVKLFYDLTGPEDAPVVAFGHSIGTSVEMWDAQVRALADRYRCLRYDARGHGRSEVVDEAVGIDDLADDLAGLLDALGIGKAHVVGLSLGGMTAQAFALRHPERTSSVVLMATGPAMPPARNWSDRAALIRREGMAAIVDATMVPRWFTPGFAERAPEKVAFTRQRFLQTDPVGYAVCCEVISRLDLADAIRAIAVPTLVIAGSEDPAAPVAMGEDMAARIPGAELEVVRAAHLLAVELADEVNGILATFLDRQSGLQPSELPGATFETGLANRKAVLGVDHVQRSLAKAGSFAMPWQDFITRNAWGEIWGDPTLPWKTRSLLTLTMMVALHREEEFKLHVRPALKNGVTVEELRAMLIQAAIYAGVPAANAAFRWVKDVLGDEID
ncbi:4-carboxymuconolactone decarboxylase /3-oxoadipate enol-lactonase [Faunimonas pinastri]|uniref:4-carboxymuconolactone decarboxylase /3-oxoadipate enol-lactonase n=1 Tax=Faunimonas pinastri TaxID=1855383 RepID=A0A1H9K770_9HYPH|nr:3-oxoadipate enol-lactonase [Faunimonas pinastri]SEQ94971.1 4-carboxymuconolactone decarboxylase /3-oxoadipate enol-lactonase [Faunimonas pinastri]